jgi:hypothetical protein
MTLSKQMIQIRTLGKVAYEERNAGAAGIYPGMLCKVDTDGDVIQHASAGGRAECLIALEDSLQGKTVATVYTIAYPVRLEVFRPGEEFHGLLKAGHTISKGEGLISAGDGTFKSATDSGLTIDAIVAYALEDEDLSASSTNTLIHMRAA